MSYFKWPENRRITPQDLQAATDAGEKWAMLTSYDCNTARIFEASGARALLVGDSAGMTVFGRDNTTSVTVDELLALAQGVVSGTKTAMVVADMPFGSYEVSGTDAVRNAVRYVKEAGAHAVKLEGGRRSLTAVESIVGANIPVMGHLGLTPQTANAIGGMRKVQGRGNEGRALLDDARALQNAGVFAVVLEAIPAELASQVSEQLDIPTIGIGAGAGCDAQIAVWQDILGLTSGRVPKFVKQYADLQSVISESVGSYVRDVEAGTYPDAEHSY